MIKNRQNIRNYITFGMIQFTALVLFCAHSIKANAESIDRIKITIAQIEALDDISDGKDNATDFYACIIVNGRQVSNKNNPTQNELVNRNSISPNWEFIFPASDFNRLIDIPITIQIWDEDSGFMRRDDLLDISSAPNDLDLNLIFNWQKCAVYPSDNSKIESVIDLSGPNHKCKKLITVKGDGNASDKSTPREKVRFQVTIEAFVYDNPELKIAAFNAQLLPSGFGDIIDKIRSACCSHIDVDDQARRIADRILVTDLDIVLLNEAFDESAKKILVRSLRSTYPYYVQEFGDGGVLFPNFISECFQESGFLPGVFEVTSLLGEIEDSGLMVFSRYPLGELPRETRALKYLEDDNEAIWNGKDWDEEVAFEKFDDCIDCDCMSSKGVGYVRIDHVPTGHVINLFVTHLQAAGDSTAKRSTRTLQMQRITEFMEDVLPQDAFEKEMVILAGDLNIDGNLANLYGVRSRQGGASR